MLTIKLYAENGFRQRIVEAESLTVLRPQCGSAEITCHGTRLNGEVTDIRFDLSEITTVEETRWERAIIENANGKTTEIIYSASAFLRKAAA